MSKKRNKHIGEGIGAVCVLVSIFAFYFTKSLAVGFVAFFLCLFLFIMIFLMRYLARKQKLNESGIREIDKMTGKQFEKYLYYLFKKFGYRVKLTDYTRDFGADLVLETRENRIVVQAKRYKKNVGLKAVQEIVSAKSYYNANQAWVVTNSFYTNQAVQLAKSNDVRLINRDELIELILKSSQTQSA